MTIIIISSGTTLIVGFSCALFVIKHWQNIRLIVSDFLRHVGFLGKSVRKFSVVNEIEGSINQIANEINKTTTDTLLPTCKIEWVDLKCEKSVLQGNEAIVCLSFDKHNHDQNFYNALHSFIKTGLVSKAKPFLNQNTRKGIDFLTTKLILNLKRPLILSKFNEHYSQQDSSFKDKYTTLETIEESGFFNNILIPEVNLFGEKVFTKTPKDKLEQEVESFIEWLYNLATRERGEMSVLNFDNDNIKLGVVFVADNETYGHYGPEAYRRRAYLYASKGYPCIYLFAIGEQKSRVCHQIAEELIKSEHFSQVNKKTEIIKYDQQKGKFKISCICLKINSDIITFDFWKSIKEAKSLNQAITCEIESLEEDKLYVSYLGKKFAVSKEELSKVKISDISQYFSTHDLLSLKIANFDELKTSITLSNKDTDTDPAKRIEVHLNSSMSFVIKKIAVNKNGDEVGLSVYSTEKDIYGFVPRSLAIFGRYTKLSQKYSINQELQLDVQKFDPDRGIYICKVNGLIDPWEQLPSETTKSDKIVTVEISEIGYSYINCSLTEGIEGKIGAVELDWDSIEANRSQIKSFSVGQKIAAKIIDMDFRNKTVYLSTKALKKNPLIDFFEKNVNGIIKGKISQIQTNGIFLSFNGNCKGFVPKSEISWFYVQDIGSRYKIGETVDVKVLEYDGVHENLICSIRSAVQNDFEKLSVLLHPGETVKGKVLRFFEDKAEIEIIAKELHGYGFVHKSQISQLLYVSGGMGAKILKPNSTYSFVILASNTNFKTFTLSRKAYYEKNIDDVEYGKEYRVNVIATEHKTYVYNDDIESILNDDIPKNSNQVTVIPARIDKAGKFVEFGLTM